MLKTTSCELTDNIYTIKLMIKNLKNKVIIITGATRGIGEAIALKLAHEGANVVVLSKDTDEKILEMSEKLQSKINAGLVLNLDISDSLALKNAIQKIVNQFTHIDALINNTSATCFEDVLKLKPEQFDLMIGTSVKAAFFLSQLCIPHLKKAPNPHIINISPPINIDPKWFKDYLGFSIAKYAMSLCTLGMAEEFKKDHIAINSLWPKSTIASQTIKDHFSREVYEASRKPEIMADATYQLLLKQSGECSGQFLIDEDFLKESGVTDFSCYAIHPESALMQSLFTPSEQNMLEVPLELFKSR